MMTPEHVRVLPQLVPAALAGCLAYLSIDFLSHAVILAPWWRATESYWLPPSELFARIPFAYAAFAIHVVWVMWLVIRIIGPRPPMSRAVWFGVVAGLVFGSTAGLANHSVFAVPVSALLVWPASAMIATLGAVAAGVSVLNAGRPWRRVVLVLVGSIALFVVGVVLQNVLSGQPGD